MTKWVYSFSAERAEGRAEMKNLLGGKGANLHEMASLGLPVPPGFTITTEVCSYFYANGKTYPSDLAAQVDAAVAEVGRLTGRAFGDAANPLLVSVRSGARASMPGMMDTVLNLGLNDTSVEALAKTSNDARFAYDSYRRFIQMYSNVVLEVDVHNFEDILEQYKEAKGYSLDTDLSAEDWRAVIADYKARVIEETGKPFPQDPRDQLWGAIGAVFSSWMNQRAVTYRRLNHIPAEWGTAVNVQAMVFGNMGETSATGVAFTRNPSTGEKALYGEFLVNAQGEDVVAGIRTPQNITEAARKGAHSDRPSLEALMPGVFKQFADTTELLEKHYKDMQDLEFTVERGKLWMLQTRNGKRTAKAALRVAVEMANEGLISREDAVTRIEPATLDQLLHPTLDPENKPPALATGLPASPGAASGEIVFSADEAQALRQAGRKSILVRVETSPEDIHGMHAAEGVVTTRGGMTSHAAVVARGMGKPCVCGVSSIRIDYARQTMTAGAATLKKGDILTIDGGSGEVMAGAAPMVKPEMTGDFLTLMGWADSVRRMKVRANAETAADARAARSFGAEGIGLCRTEHMFFDGERIVAVREMILADNEQGRRAALAKLLPMQRQDFAELFEIMTGLPVTIRLLDPPLHEFLPKTDEEISEVARVMKVSADKLRARAAELHEFNPMLGFRGVRLAIRYPEIAEMQARAIFEGAIQAGRKTGKPVTAEIMVPLVFGPPGTRSGQGDHRRHGRGGRQGDGREGPLFRRHDDRTAARGAARGRDRGDGRVLLVRHQRPHADHARRVARRCGVVPRLLHPQRAAQGRSVRNPGHGGRRRARHHRRRARPQDAARSQARRLRRARRRSGLDRVLRGGASRLCVVLALPHPDRPPRRRAGGAGAEGAKHRVRARGYSGIAEFPKRCVASGDSP